MQLATLMTTAKVGSSLVRFSFGPVAFARVLPRQHEQVVRESPMVPGWIPWEGSPPSVRRLSRSDLGCMVSYEVSDGMTFESSWQLELGSTPK